MANAATATYSGRSILWNRMKGAGTEPKNLSWGTPAAALTGSANSDVALFSPATEARVAGTSSIVTTTQLGDTYQVTGTITCLVAGKTVTEAGLHDSTTASPVTSLAATIASTGATSLTIASATGTPANLPGSGNYYAQIENEVVLVTGGQGTTLLTVTRSALGSTAATHVSAAVFTLGGDGGAGTGGATSGQTATIGATQGGNLFAHADYGGIVLNVNDSIAYTWKDQLT